MGRVLGALSAGVRYLLQVDLIRLERLREVAADGGDEGERQQLERQIAHAREQLEALARVPGQAVRLGSGRLATGYILKQGLASSAWQLLEGYWCGAGILRQPGLYRPRRAGRGDLDSIGETGGSLRQRLGMLASVYGALMPYRDPHAAGPGCRALRRDCDSDTLGGAQEPRGPSHPGVRVSREPSVLPLPD